MKTRELSMGEKKDIVKLKEEGKTIRAISKALGIATTTVWNVLKKQETTGLLTTKHRTGRPRKTTAAEDKEIERAVQENPQITVSHITNNLHMQGVKVSEGTVRRRLREQKYRYHYISLEPPVSTEADGSECAEDTEMSDVKQEQCDELCQQTECVDDNISSDDRTNKDMKCEETEGEASVELPGVAS